MLVLNTTSPPVSPAAPAASPSYQMPFSSARMAFISCSCPVFPSSGFSSSFVFQRYRDALHLAGGDARVRGDRPLAVHFDADHVRTGAHVGHRQRRLPDRPAVDEHGGAARPRVDIERADEAA